MQENYFYQLALVSFFDILGMKSLLDSSGSDAGRVASVLKIFREFSKPDEDLRKDYEWKFVNFSDLNLRVLPVETEINRNIRYGPVFHEIMDLCHIQVNLLAQGILIRGALTLGNIAVVDGLVFGPALVTAAQMEKADPFPRIVVDASLVRELQTNKMLRTHGYAEEIGYLENILVKDAAGVFFINYLGYLSENADDNLQHIEFLQSHRQLINDKTEEIQALGPSDKTYSSRVKKLDWMRRLHNRHIDTLNAAIVKSETGVDRETLFL